MHNDDNGGLFPINANLGGAHPNDWPKGWPTTGFNWVGGMRSGYQNGADDTDAALLVDPRYTQLAPYVTNQTVYRCPADKSTSGASARGGKRGHSYAMSSAIGGKDMAGHPRGRPTMFLQYYPPPAPAKQWLAYTKDEQTVGLGPADVWVLTEQQPDTVNDGVLET